MVVQDYDKEPIIPLFMKVSQILTPHCNHRLAKIEQVSNGFVFGIEVSNEEATHALLVKDFHCLKELLLALRKLQNLWSHGKIMKFNL